MFGTTGLGSIGKILKFLRRVSCCKLALFRKLSFHRDSAGLVCMQRIALFVASSLASRKLLAERQN